MISLKDYLVNLLPNYIIDNDSYKDINGKGFVQRFLEIFGLELDEYYYNTIDTIVDQVNPKLTSKVDFLDYIALMLGDTPDLESTPSAYRNLLTFIVSIYKVKGTHNSYKWLLYVIGLEATIEELPPETTQYDDDEVLYDNDEYYDVSCDTCSYYNLHLVGSGTLSAATYNKVLTIVDLLEPIHAKLGDITYNGDVVNFVVIEVEIDSNGDLVYNNDNDPTLVLTLVNGDLIISGDNADKYYLNSEGDLIYIY